MSTFNILYNNNSTFLNLHFIRCKNKFYAFFAIENLMLINRY